MEKTASVSGAQTIHKAISLLKFIARFSGEGARLIDLVRGMEIGQPTAHRLLQALVAEGLVKQDTSHRYHLGSLVFELSLTSGHHFNLADICTPVLKKLADETGDTSFLFLRSGDDAICLAREQGPYHIQTPVVPVGSRQPLGVSAGGLAILSALSEQEAAAVLKAITPRLVMFGNLTTDRVWEYYLKSNAVGYAAISNRAAPGVKGVGVPIIGEIGTPIAAVTLATTISRMTEERIQEIIPALNEAAEQIDVLLRQF
ncbi:IclR family transcriptional regulator [Microvirga sp. W0021]|uniref:IclR family transcriptional regulator n=1 Tax=Hohaiivirga grylli TaxID=3133970 RepID=A0ABV0BLB5_9HYPH